MAVLPQHEVSNDGKTVVLQLDGVSVAFGSGASAVQVTDGVSFTLRKGETVALVGESGSGKSVTAMSILALLPGNAHATGSIRFGGIELVDAPESVIRAIRGSRIGVIFQEPMTALNPVYTIGALIEQALQSQHKRSRTAARERTLELLRLVGMPEPEARIKQYPHELSGGQRQRAMIAMAISGDPEVLIADEPTTALDVTIQADILALLESLRRRLGMAMIFITHDMGVVAEVADRVCVMRNGKVIEQATVFELFENPKEEYTRELLDSVPYLGVDAATAPISVIDRSAAPSSIPEQDAIALEVSDLSVRYPGRFGKPSFMAVDDVSFSVPRGEIVGLVGESGSGKSTIGRSIIGLVAHSAGQIQLDGRSLSGLSSRALRKERRNLGVVFQDPASSLNPRATIGDSIVEPLRRYGVVRGARQLRLRGSELLDRVELPSTWSDRYPHELSGGQRQRVGIARAIALEPALLIADEPTSALDVSVQATVLELFQQLQRDLGFSCLFISHDLAVVEMLASRVIVLRGGKIVEEGLGRQILREPRHEYTKSLIAAAPVPDPVVQKRRAALRRAG